MNGEQSRDAPDRHAALCAARNWPSAAFFVVLCAAESLLAWKFLRQDFPPFGFAAFCVALAVVALGASLFLVYRCVRERFISGQFILRGVIGFATFAAPEIGQRFGGEIRRALLALWAGALAIAVSLLLEALFPARHRKR